jgi:hypothetical protein
MVSISASATKQKEIKYYIWVVYDNVVVDQNDTVTCYEFTDDVALSESLLINNASGAVITTTEALNVVTVTGAATDADCTLFVFGRRA